MAAPFLPRTCNYSTLHRPPLKQPSPWVDLLGPSYMVHVLLSPFFFSYNFFCFSFFFPLLFYISFCLIFSPFLPSLAFLSLTIVWKSISRSVPEKWHSSAADT